MPQPTVRPNIVVLLTELESTPRDDSWVLYRHNGTAFTDAEHDLIGTATPAEITAAKAQRRLQNDWARETHEAEKALVDLVTKYIDRLPEGSLCSNIYATMSDEDYAECDRLARIVAARHGTDYPAEDEDS
ncbi:hypothetical protein [Streptomyces cahuitamycinicus]|jgi:hypothetical protein|uniref:Uncharacterized protein n=1 Tax=Streptomyces cahuitamycinicus TaxID=2070367 RepID=A0A2N8TM56_9ACTN|nr:hypothetical protein [Streptomyces cahuitamycinicus]PNG20053.1 hypothetical protein C1J00_22305 [Streptomyces cahuitamycinicus]